MFSTNCVIEITQYYILNHFHHYCIGGLNKKIQMKCIPLFDGKHAPQAKFCMKQNTPQDQSKCAAGQIF